MITSNLYTVGVAEAMPSIATSTAIFANAPIGTQMVRLTIRTAGLTMRADAGTATAGANGIDYATGTFELQLNQQMALACRAIQNGGTTTGYIEYLITG